MGIIYNRKDTTVPFVKIDVGEYFVVRTQANVPLLYRRIKYAMVSTPYNAISMDTGEMECFCSDDKVLPATVDIKVTY